MNDELAGRLLDELMDWTDEEQAEWMAKLRRLASYKYDHYARFAPGERFFESLARWLVQFDDPQDRRRLITFVRKELVFLSRDELNHAIACAYPDFIKPDLIAAVSKELDAPRWRVRQVVESPEFKALRRRTLYLGLSDGARLDQLRRLSPELSHEQFWLTPELGANAQTAMTKKLGEALEKLGVGDEPRFRRIVFVDDFYGSGTSLLHEKSEDNSSVWGGKLTRAGTHVEDLQEADILEPEPHVTVLLYLASAHAEAHIRASLQRFQPGWELRVVQQLPDDLGVTDHDLLRLCEEFFDPALADEHKGQVPYGYGEVALPLVLHQNTPNNSVCLLWADTTQQEGSQVRRALFPRYERHHVDRP